MADDRVTLSRRSALQAGAGALVWLALPRPGRPVRLPWWHRYPSFAQVSDAAVYARTKARMAIVGAVADPTWGPYAQRLTELDGGAVYRRIRALGGPTICWIEGFGDCMLYAVALQRLPDGSFERRKDDPTVTLVKRSHWNWADRRIAPGNTLAWVGIHATLGDEAFVRPRFGRERSGIKPPTYPDGRSALGVLPEGRYPLNARVYDACGAKDVNGRLAAAYEPPARVNDIDPATGRARGPFQGLWPAMPGEDEVSALPGAKPGEPVWCGVISVHKDLSAPFWRDYVRRSVREILKQGMDGVWCDNFSPWDNFGYPPVRKAFGDWSAHGFGRYLAALPAAERTQLGAPNPAALDVRRALKARAGSYGAKDPSVLDDAAWRDRRWLSDPLWSTYKAYRQEAARRDLRAFYQAIHDEARKAGRPDFCIGGNDIPLYGLGWVRDTWLDMVNTETTPGWHMGAGARGITIPPAGKMAVVYRAAREHQKGPFTAAWYYLNNGYERYQRRPGIARVLLAEAFANGAFLMCDPDQAQVVGTVDVHAWWNAFVRRNEQRLGQREPMADTAVLFSPDCQLGELAPGGFPDMDRQPHVFGHWGWATALIDGHRPYRALPDWKVNAASLAGLCTLVVPDAEWLDEPVVRALEAWTRGGGHLVLTGMCGAAHGPAGRFRPRPEPALASLVTRAGGKLAPGAPSLHAGRADLGRVTWTAEPLGMDYYLDIPGRAARLEALLALVPASQVLDAHTMPTTVGIAPWLSADGETRYADLVNYALDTDGDRVTPATQLEFRVKAPAGWRRVRAETLTPDDVPPATAVAADGMVTVRLPRLVHYASVRLSGES